MSIQVLSTAMGDNRSFQPPASNNSPSMTGMNGLSSAVHRHTEQLLARAGILANVGHDADFTQNPNLHRAHSEASGIVSHLRSSLAPRQDVESALRARGQQLSRDHDLEKALTLARYRQAVSMFPNVNRYTAGSLLGQPSTLGPSFAMLPSAAAMLSSRLSVPRPIGAAGLPDVGAGITQDPTLLAMLASSGIGAAGIPPAAAQKRPAKRSPIVLFMECDEDSLSEYQCLIRKQIELFEADKEEAASSVQGRNKQIVEGQVGIRCRHCTVVPPRRRQKGCMYFPTKLDRIYQAAQNLSAFHLCEHCKHVPEDVRKKILVLRERKSPAGGGKRYWGEGVRCLGVIEESNGLRFK